MTLQELQQKANTKLATFWTALQTKQNAYYAKHGKYFQMLISPIDPVVDGLDSDHVNRIPSDEKSLADRVFTFTEKIPFQIEVNEWQTTDPNNILIITGAGYSATVSVQLPDGRVFKRSRDNLNVDSGWYLYEPITPTL